MLSEEIEKRVQEILYGKAIVEIINEQNNACPFIIRSMTGRENSIVHYTHQQAIQEGRKAKLCTQIELVKEFNKRGTWTEKDDLEIESLQVGIGRLQKILPDYEFQKARYKSIERRISKARKDLAKLESAKHKLFTNCLEYRAQEMKFRKLAFFCLETIDEQSMWTWEEFQNFTDFIFINNVMQAYINVFILESKIVRELARSAQWRYRWNAVKNGVDVFGRPTSEWSEAQGSLIYWSLYYDNIFDHPNCPMNLIDNDEALDVWMAKDRKEREKDVLNNSKDTKAKSSKNGLQEVFIVTDKGDKETVEKIQSMNDPGTRKRLQRERKELEKKGKVSEWKLRKGQYQGKNG